MSNLAGRLQQLAELHKSGVLTDEEFQAAKQAEIASERGPAGSPPAPAGTGAIAPRPDSSACPICHKDDQVAKASHVAASGASHSSFSGSMQGGGRAGTRSIPTWRPLDLGDWYTSSTSFDFAAAITLSETTTTTLASQLAPPLPPPRPIPQGGDQRYALYLPLVHELWNSSYYCSRDGVVFI